MNRERLAKDIAKRANNAFDNRRFCFCAHIRSQPLLDREATCVELRAMLKQQLAELIEAVVLHTCNCLDEEHLLTQSSRNSGVTMADKQPHAVSPTDAAESTDNVYAVEQVQDGRWVVSKLRDPEPEHIVP